MKTFKVALSLLFASFIFVGHTSAQVEADSFLYQSIHQNQYFESLADSFSVDINTKHIFNFQKSHEEASKFYRVMFDGQVKDDKQETLTYFYESGKGVIFGKEGTIINKVEVEHKEFGDPKYTKAFSEPLNMFADSIVLAGEKNFLYTPFGKDANKRFEYHLMDLGNDEYKVTFNKIGDRKNDDNYFVVNSRNQVTNLQWTVPNDYKLPLVDSIIISQEYIYLNDSIIMPVAQNIEYMAGYEDYYSVGKISTDFSNLMLNVNLKDSSLFKPKMMIETDTDRKMSTIMTFEDSESEENFIVFHEQNDSLSFLDSIDKKYNAFDALTWMFIGYQYHDRKKHTAVSLNPFISNVQFNMVEGRVLNLGAKFIKKHEKHNDIIAPDYRKSFDGSAPYARLEFKRENRELKSDYLSLSMGSYIYQFNNDDPFPFSMFLLLFPSDININKLYSKDFIKLRRGIGKSYDWKMDFSFEYATRRSLQNLSNPLGVMEFPYFPDDEMINDSLGDTYIGFQDHKIFEFGLKTDLTINHANADLNNNHNLQFNYNTAIPNIVGTDADFTVVELGLHGVKDASSLKAMRYHTKIGQFWGTSNMHFMDYHHMNTSRMFIYETQTRPVDQFYFMEYYGMSNNTWYAEAHVTRDFSHLIRGKQYIGNFNIGGEFHFGYTPENDHYTEIVTSISGRLRVVKASFIWGLKGTKLDRFGVNFGVTI